MISQYPCFAGTLWVKFYPLTPTYVNLTEIRIIPDPLGFYQFFRTHVAGAANIG